MTELYLGLMSGTSMDGVDAVLAELDATRCEIRAARTTPYPAALLRRLRAVVDVPRVELAELGALDTALGRFFAGCALDAVAAADLVPRDVAAIGHHGHTIFHAPNGTEPFTMQIGDPNLIAAITGITTVADFRRLDIAHGGQGAPLLPAFHAWHFGDGAETRAVVNIGGIANITVLDPRRPPIGGDTGPGNTLLDVWIERCRGAAFDRDGAFGASGRVDGPLLARFLDDPYFAARLPKSTGREHFNLRWIERRLGPVKLADEDVQATLAELTATTIADAIRNNAPDCRRIVVCGGGAHNPDLLERLARLAGIGVTTSAELGVAPDWVEGAGFAWLARARLELAAGNLPSVTGAKRPAVLGGVYWATIPSSPP